MKTVSFLLLSVSVFTYSVSRADDYLCYGSGFAYTTKAPKGWKLDNQSGKPNLCIVGYPIGSSWAKGETVIYMNPSAKGNTKGSRDLEDMIAYDLAKHKETSPAIVIRDGDVVFNNNRRIQTKYFLNDQKQGNFEAVGYIDEPKAVVFAVMSSRNKDGFDKALPAFKEFIQNYQFITSDVKFNKKK